MRKKINLNKSLAALLHGAHQNAPSMGMADGVPAMVDGQQPAALSSGEVVVPADVVSLLGDGNTEAGAKVLMSMFAEIRKMKTGTHKQPPMVSEAISKFLGKR